MATAIVHHPVFVKHDTGQEHPESPSRYSVVMDALRRTISFLLSRMLDL